MTNNDNLPGIEADTQPAMLPCKPIKMTVIFPSSMGVGRDRAKWYLEGAIRGWWQSFATDTDPIRMMRKAMVIFYADASVPHTPAPFADLVERMRAHVQLLAGVNWGVSLAEWCEISHDILALADTALSALPAQSGWLPIESAPKMKEILLWADTSTPDFPNWRMASGYYHSEMNVWIWGGEQVHDWNFPPTHWQPLPAAPGTEQPDARDALIAELVGALRTIAAHCDQFRFDSDADVFRLIDDIRATLAKVQVRHA